MKNKTFSEICIEADNNSKDLYYLHDLWNYVWENKYQYSVVEHKFFREHVLNYVSKIETEDAKIVKSNIEKIMKNH